MKTTRYIFTLLLCLFFSCSAYDQNKKESVAAADSNYSQMETPGSATAADKTSLAPEKFSSRAAEVVPGSNRKFIRTTDMRFRVKNVPEATQAMEDAIIENGGFITRTNLRSENVWTNSFPISKDSMVNFHHYRYVNEAEFRVPAEKLDATLKRIFALADFIDYRVIKSDDKSFEYLQNELNQKRLEKQNKRLSGNINKRPGDVLEATDAEERLMNKEEQLDYSIVDQYRLKDQIDFSTVTIYMYQKESIVKEIQPIVEDPEMYEPGFFTRLGENIKEGGEYLLEFILALLNVWPLVIVLGVGGYYVVKFVKRRK